MNCCECGARITDEEDAMHLPGKLFICEVCWNFSLDKPISGEKEGTQTSRTAETNW